MLIVLPIAGVVVLAVVVITCARNKKGQRRMYDDFDIIWGPLSLRSLTLTPLLQCCGPWSTSRCSTFRADWCGFGVMAPFPFARAGLLAREVTTATSTSFWAISRALSSALSGAIPPGTQARTAQCALLSEYADRVLTGACNPMVRPIHGLQVTASQATSILDFGFAVSHSSRSPRHHDNHAARSTQWPVLFLLPVLSDADWRPRRCHARCFKFFRYKYGGKGRIPDFDPDAEGEVRDRGCQPLAHASLHTALPARYWGSTTCMVGC